MDYNKYGKIGEGENDLQYVTLVDTDEAYALKNDDNLEPIDLPENKEKPMLEPTRLLRSVNAGKTDAEIKELQGTTWSAVKLPAQIKKELRETVENNKEKVREFIREHKTGAKISVLSAAALVAIAGCGKQDTAEATAEPTVIEATTEEEATLNLENVSYNTLIEALKSGKLNGIELNETQRQELLDAINFISNNAQQEDWEKVTIEDEEVLAAANDRLESLGYPLMNGNTAQWGYENSYQVISAMIRLNKNLTNEDIARITGGNLLDVSNIMDTSSNEFINKEMQRYLFGGFRNENGLDVNHYNVTGILGFGEHETQAYNDIAALINEYSSLKNEGNREEAEIKMAEIEDKLMSILTSPGYDGNFKEYIGETVYVAALVESQVENYHREITITVIDTRTNKEVELTRKVRNFDAYQNARVISGLDTFDEIAYLEENNIDSNRYKMVISTVDESIVNAVCGTQRERLEEYNEWLKFISEDELAAIREDTLVLKDVLEIVDKEFAGKYYSVNIQYYNSFCSLYVTKELINNNENANTNGNNANMPVIPGNTATSSISFINVPEGQNPYGLDPATNAQLQAQAAAAAGAVTTAQANQYNAALQEIYNAAYNYYYGQTIISTSVTFDPAWLNSNDPFIVNAVNTAHAQADAEKYGSNGATYGGGTTGANGVGTISDTTAPTATQGNTTTETVVNSDQSSIDQQMANVEAYDIGNGGVVIVPADSEDTVTVILPDEKDPNGPQQSSNANSTNNAPTGNETYNSEEEALAALNSGYKSRK